MTVRDLPIEILEDKDGNDANDNSDGCNRNHHCCDQHQVSYDELGNERHKAVCGLRGISVDELCKKYDYVDVYPEFIWSIGQATGLRHGAGFEEIISSLIHLLGGDECNFSGAESYMNAMGEKSNPAETSDESTDHVSFDTRLKLKTYAYIILEFADTLGIDYPNGSKITDVAAEIRKKLSVLMSECKVMGFAKSDEIAKPESKDGGEVTITDEMREWIKSLYTPNSDELKLEGLRITDRIDEQFDRICQQQENALQSTIDSMCDEQDRLQERLRAAELGCDANHRLAEANARWCDELVDLLRDAAREYKDKHYWKQVWRGRADDMRMERDELQEKCDRLKTKVEHQREQLAVYSTMYDFDAIRALKRERNEHKHRADNAEGHIKSLERRLDVAHETYCALLNDAAREFRALTEERDELQASLDDYDKTHVELPKDENDEYIYIGDVMDGYAKTIEVVELRYGRSGWMLISRDGNGYADTFAFAHHHAPTVEQVIRDLTLGKITESQAIERIEGINGQG